jgi:hypothetical protein
MRQKLDTFESFHARLWLIRAEKQNSESSKIKKGHRHILSTPLFLPLLTGTQQAVFKP